MIHEADKQLKVRWKERFLMLPPEARTALKSALNDLRVDCQQKAKYSWKKHKAPMALYWKVVGVYAGHIARCL
jgi:hypothetical protein